MSEVGSSARTGSVKQENREDAEILALAAHLIEARRLNAAGNLQAANNLINRAPQLVMHRIRPNQNSNGRSTDSTSVDERTARGQFGWVTLGNADIPYMYRGETRYCAVRMLETKVITKFLNTLSQDVFACTCIRSFYCNEVECRLFNEINFLHSDSTFGREPYTVRDIIVQLADAIEFYDFLDACYSKLTDNISYNPRGRCGFIRINKESVVPYTLYKGTKFVPLFYFEGETDNLKLRAEKLEGWDLAYLKFCCKVQGIRNELFSHDSCSVISLVEIQNYFPAGTQFENYWPNKTSDANQLLISGKPPYGTVGGPNAGIQWTRSPTTAPPPLPATSPSHFDISLTPPPPQKHVQQQLQQTQQQTQQQQQQTQQQNILYPPYAHPAQYNSGPARCNMGGAGATQQQQQQQAQRNVPAYSNASNAQVQQQQRQTSQQRNATSGSYYNVPPPLTRAAQPYAYGKDSWSAAANANAYAHAAAQTAHAQAAAHVSAAAAATYMMLQQQTASPHQVAQAHREAQREAAHKQREAATIAAAAAAAAQLQQPKYPPPLIPVRQLNGGMRSNMGLGAPGPMPTLQPINPQQQGGAPAEQHQAAQAQAQQNGRHRDTYRKMLQLQHDSLVNDAAAAAAAANPDNPAGVGAVGGNSHGPGQGQGQVPFRMHKVVIEGKMIHGINMKPFVHSNGELLVSLQDLMHHFFCGVSLHECTKVMQLLNIDLFNGNGTQMLVLYENGKCTSPNDVVPMVQARKVIEFMPQLRYMLNCADLKRTS